MEERTGGTRAGLDHGLGPGGHGPPPWWAGEPARVPPRAPLPSGRCPLYDQARPATPLLDSSAHTRRPSRRPPHRLGPRCPACSTARPRLPPPRCGHRGRGTLVVGAGPWARIAPGGGPRGRNASKGPRAPPSGRPRGAPRRWSSGTVPAQRPHRSWTPGGGGYRAPSCPGVQADDHRIQAVESALSPWATRRGVNEPARHRGRPPVSKGPTSESTVLAALPLPRVGTRRRSRPAPLVVQVIGQLSGQPASQGPLFEQSGEQAIGPSDHRPRPNRSARTSRPTPHRNATAPPHPRPPTRAITSSVITYRSFQIKGIHRQLNTPQAHPAALVPPDPCRRSCPGRVDHLHDHPPVPLCDHPTPRTPSNRIAGLNIQHQTRLTPSDLDQVETLHPDEQITPITATKRTTPGTSRVRYCRGPWRRRGLKSAHHQGPRPLPATPNQHPITHTQLCNDT